MDSIFNRLKDYSRGEIVTRKEIERLTGGLLKTGTLAYFDSIGRGIKCSITIGNKKMYHIDAVIEWLEGNAVLAGF